MIFSIGVWSSALIGIALKLTLPGRFDRLAIALYLLLGWCGVAAYDLLASAVPSSSLWLLVIGGVLYSIGIVVSWLAPAALSQRDLAQLRADRSRLPLFSCSYLPDFGMIGEVTRS